MTATMSKTPVTFERAFKRLPAFLMGGFDPRAHTAVEDLGYLVQFQIDLYREGEESDITSRRQLASARAFLKFIGFAEAE